ncbi:limbic system-associated membrane protein-like isoform X2 [Tubulanus polymorphus]|uniref:limbic system-associated membrane protein-like isoform X2 n=1 Tax=Tubulanus polymorphus TaxID=672921 RepID=UPI003DA5DA5B
MNILPSVVVLMEVLGLQPTFDVPVVNISMVATQTAVLPCSVENLGTYEVVWTDKSHQTLTYNDRRVVDDSRISIERPYKKEWNLVIRSVQHSDQGIYRCSVNTDPVKSKEIYLKIKVPPKIIESQSSNDVIVKEGDTVQLVCNATGVPLPTITWYRVPSKDSGAEKERIGLNGEMIIIHNISRYCDDHYECIASNGVSTDVGRKMKVTVHFPPEIRLPNRRIGQSLKLQTMLECEITANPHYRSYWLRKGQEVITTDKYQVDMYDAGDRTKTLTLTITGLEPEDYGDYKCVSQNSLGYDEKVMELYEYTDTLPKYQIKPDDKTDDKKDKENKITEKAKATPRTMIDEKQGPPYIKVPIGESKRVHSGDDDGSSGSAVTASHCLLLLPIGVALIISRATR